MAGVQTRAGTRWAYVIDVEGVEIPFADVVELTIRESVFDLLPRLFLEIKDVGLFTSDAPIHSGDRVRVAIMNMDNQAVSSEFRFSVESFTSGSVDPNVPNSASAKIVGLYNAPKMYDELKCRSFGKRKFSAVVSEVAGDCGLKADVRKQSNDAMPWGCFNQTYMDFLRSSIPHSYISKTELPVLFSTKSGELVYCGIDVEKKSDTAISLAFDSLGTVTPMPFDMDKVRNGKSSSKVVVPYSSWSVVDLKEYANVFCGGSGMDIHWFDGKFHSEKFGDGKITKSFKFGVKSDNVHEYYYYALGNNANKVRSIFSNVLTLTTGLYGFKPMDRVYVSIPSEMGKGVSQELSGEYMVFQVLTAMNRDISNEILCLIPVGK